MREEDSQGAPTDEQDSTQDGLWPFSVRLYGRADVSHACLALQEGSGVNVPVLLFAAWLGRRSQELDAASIARICAEVAPWHDEVVRPLRRLRQALKTGPHPAPSPATQALRASIERCELQAERVEIAHLESLARAVPHCDDDPATIVTRNLTGIVLHYSGKAPDATARGLITTLCDAACAL